VGSAGQILETELRGKTLTIDWMEGTNAIFKLGEVQSAAGGAGEFYNYQGLRH
jgi:hypothetical protein